MEPTQDTPTEQNTLPRTVYASSTWWNDRFKAEGSRTFDWYVGYKELNLILQSAGLNPSSRVLVVGCGNSRLSLDLYKSGIKNIVNIDIADTVLETMRQMAEKEGCGQEMVWQQMDATQMSFADGEFDLVLDKGTLDAVLCGAEYDIPNKLLKEMYRVTKPGSAVLLVTHSPPANRKFLFEWNFIPTETRIYFGQVDLSPEVNMLNIFRSIGKQKSLSEIIKDPALFAECMAAVQKDTKQRLVMRKLKEAVAARIVEKRKQKAALLAEQGIIADKPSEYVELFAHPGFEHIPFEKMEISVASMTQAEAQSKGIEIGKDIVVADIEAESEDAQPNDPENAVEDMTQVKLKKKTIVKVVDSGYNPPRQDHCFVYLVYKTPNTLQQPSAANTTKVDN